MIKIAFDYSYVKEYIDNFNYKLISDTYKNIREKLIVKCPNGHVYETSFKNFKEGSRCVLCRKVSYEQYVDKAKSNNYEVVSKKEEFKNSRSCLLVRCKYGHIGRKRYDNLVQGCAECNNIKQTNDYNKVKKFIESYEYKLLSDNYTNNYSKLKIKCPNNHIYETTYSSFKEGTRCRQCFYDSLRKDENEVKNILKYKGYDIICGEYINTSSKVTVKCKNNHEWDTTYGRIFIGSDCPRCNKLSVSKGEDRICRFLECNNIKFKRQYTFDDCIDKRKLPFDFYLTDYNVCIEYDGEQHFKEKFSFNDKNKSAENFKKTLLHDNIKNEYCKTNKIKLIRIPYWDLKNIENILTQKLNINLE